MSSQASPVAHSLFFTNVPQKRRGCYQALDPECSAHDAIFSQWFARVIARLFETESYVLVKSR